ncbi:SurA N-terminal domain-containing protein [Alcanivorax sp. S6407]|uniref:SurA N-terminal domain-containing protein n=1 Tax=Alcanivorax sp. S6407 TaxID=2926424 RepID=UPI001FF197A9|nr:SurA N-terminal domain-containing protein [Alcanivorax sp. S6407]MCK0152625.1 SurA N-terminal domain-containing protein [Alcanivorax sp. S6407]
MQEFRRFVRGPVGKVLLAAIILPFVISGFYGYFVGGGSGDVVAEVEGNSITRRAVNQRVERVRDMLRQQSPNMNPAMLDSFVRPEMVLDGLVNEQLILSAAENAGMVFSEVQVAQDVRNIELFQQDGKFSNERFERELRARGMTPQGYIRGLRQDMVKEQFRSGFMATDFALPVELNEQRRLGEQVRDIRYAQLDLNALRQTFTVSDEEIQSYYTDNQDEFMRPEEFRIAYVELSTEDYADKVTVSDEDVAAEYEVRKAIMEDSAANTARHVSHILIEVGGERDLDAAKARAGEAADAIAGGMSFADAAAKYSDDPGSANDGGDLGVVSKGALPEEMEAAIAELQPDVVSAPVVSDAGVHLIKVTDVAEQREMPALEDLAGQIRNDLLQARAEALLADDVATLEELLYEHGDLQSPAEQVNSQVQTTDWVPLSALPAALASPQVQQALSTQEVRREGHNSELIEVNQGRYLAVRIADEKPAEALPLEEVSFAIRERIKGDMAADKVQTLFAEAEAKVAEGADLETIAGLFDTQVEEQEGLQRGGAEPSMEVVNGAFALPRPAEDATSSVALIRTGNGSLVAYQLTRVEDGNAQPLNPQQQAAALGELSNVEGQRNFRQVVALLREEGSVELFPGRLSPNADDSQ